MMDGDVSYSSEFKLFTLGADVGRWSGLHFYFFPLLFFFSFYFTVVFTSFVFIVFLNRGLIPRMGKTHR
jgi:hypothetical protein